jgi:hypothetical protein
MSRDKVKKMIRIGSGLVPVDGPEFKADYEARLKAAGLDADSDGLSQDEWRLRFARRIDLMLNEWPGCPEPICRRMRGCMAPSGGCVNVPPVSEEEMEADWPAAKLELRRALDKVLTERGIDRG